MASGTTEEFYCGTYIRGRIRWTTTAVSGGHNVEMHMDVYRTNIYNGDIYNNRQTDTLYCDGQTASWYNTTISNQRSWHELFAMTKFVGHSAAKTITIGWSTDNTYSWYNGSWYGSITLEALGQKASGLSVSSGDRTWNSVKVSGSVTSWGVGPGPNYVALAVFPGNKDVNSWGGPRLEWTADNQGNTKSWPNKGPATIALEGGLTIKGCYPYKVGLWANNRYEAAWTIRNEVYYTPPPNIPWQNIEVISDTPLNKTTTRVTFRVTEDASKFVSGIQVKTTLRLDYGVGSWDTQESAKHIPGTPVTFTYDLPQNTNIVASMFTTYYYGNNDQYSVRSGDTNVTNFYITKQMEPPAPEYRWNDDRTQLIVTIKANSDYANYMQCRWGYDDSVSSVLWQGNTGATPVTSNWSHDASVQYPNHGSGQFIYLKLRSRYQDNTWEDGDVFAVPVANPIIGVATYTNSNKKYIVDIVEHKADNTVTPLWQNGQRIVKK